MRKKEWDVHIVRGPWIELVTRLYSIQQHSTPKAKRVVVTVPAQKDWFDTLDDEETKDKRALVYDVTTPKQQVWPLTRFFLFPFCENSLICLEGKSMTPLRGNSILFRSSQQLPRLRLRPLEGSLSRHATFQGPSTCLWRCFQNYRDTRTQSGVPR